MKQSIMTDFDVVKVAAVKNCGCLDSILVMEAGRLVWDCPRHGGRT